MSQPSARHEDAYGFRIWRVRSTSTMELPHTHPDIEMNFLFPGGHTRYLHGGSIRSIEGGRLALLWGGVPHQTINPGIVGQGIWATLPLSWFLQWELPHGLARRLLAGDLIVGEPRADDLSLLERWHEDYRSGTPERQRVLLLEIEARLHRLALEQPRRTPKSRRGIAEGLGLIGRVTRFIAENYREPLTVVRIAKSAGVNEKYLMRAFRRQCRLGVWEYVTRLRVSHAQRLLIATDLKILDVAMESGFASAAPFYAAFTRHSRGLRPLDYRRRHRIPAAS